MKATTILLALLLSVTTLASCTKERAEFDFTTHTSTMTLDGIDDNCDGAGDKTDNFTTSTQAE